MCLDRSYGPLLSSHAERRRDDVLSIFSEQSSNLPHPPIAAACGTVRRQACTTGLFWREELHDCKKYPFVGRSPTSNPCSANVAAISAAGHLRNRTIIVVMLHTGLRRACMLRRDVVILGKRSGRLQVYGKRNTYPEVRLNAVAPAALPRHDLRYRFGARMAVLARIEWMARIRGHDSLDTRQLSIRRIQQDVPTRGREDCLVVSAYIAVAITCPLSVRIRLGRRPRKSRGLAVRKSRTPRPAAPAYAAQVR